MIGGSGVLGGALALALAKAGARVAVGYSQNREGAEKVAAAITGAGGSARAVRVDATSKAALEHARAEVTSWFGPIHLMVNAPGTQSTTPVL